MTCVASPSLPKGSERILMVDDEQMIADLGTRILGQLGYHVVTRTSAIDAIEVFRSSPDQFDLVITDYAMPDLNGIELATKILEIRQNVPVIVCTAGRDRIADHAARSLGIQAFVMKPLDRRQLAVLVRKVLDG